MGKNVHLLGFSTSLGNFIFNTISVSPGVCPTQLATSYDLSEYEVKVMLYITFRVYLKVYYDTRLAP